MISKKKLALMAMMVMSLGVTSGNPYGLVYANAITHNEKGQVNIHPVHYDLDGRTIAANVYTPKNYDPAKSPMPLSLSSIPMAASRNRSPACMPRSWPKPVM